MRHSVPVIDLFECGIIFAYIFVRLVVFVSGIPDLVDVLASTDAIVLVANWCGDVRDNVPHHPLGPNVTVCR